MSNQKSAIGSFARKWYATAAGQPRPSMNRDGPARSGRKAYPGFLRKISPADVNPYFVFLLFYRYFDYNKPEQGLIYG
ncbi:MAG: hypothetical protein ABS46_17725 [Cytophagaceae bacterium SCN 52-12]|nr:MAG: hypothetical protein ABS46_17725 [Cytophagaceae bacterium SCN 52-12]